MCGIAGIIGLKNEKPLNDMVAVIKHRGPDNTGILIRDNVGFGHARLSIIDTSVAANQPMSSSCGRFLIIFNGEIYNFLSLRSELEARGHVFKTASDTEVILAMYKQEGSKCFEKLSGMFAIAIYDFKQKSLVLARDRMGEKPLYWSHQNGVFIFASELKGLTESGLFHKEINLYALDAYLQFDYVPTPMSMLNGVNKLEPATILTFKGKIVSKEKFWLPPQKLLKLNEADAIQKLDKLLQTTISNELVSDVPIGVFLSGGIDSSTIAYYAQLASQQPIDTFSIGFDEASFDESIFAREVATYLGTHHHEKIIQAKDALDLIPSLGEVLSEPVADASIIPTLLLSKFTQKSVTVALGGDGGDELFAGYPTFQAETLYRAYATFPEPIRHFVHKIIQTIPTSHNNFSFSYNLKKLVSSDERDVVRRHLEWVGTFSKNSRSALAGPTLSATVNDTDVFESIEHTISDFTQDDENNRLLFAYARSYLLDQVLVKVDRASMHYALETRAPFLDHTVADLVFSLPYSLKYNKGTTKYILKKMMKGKLPEHIIHRKKKGFGIPLARWLTGPLRPLAEELLSRKSLSAHGLFNTSEVARLLDDHMNERRDNRKEIWNIMIFQLWYKRWMR